MILAAVLIDVSVVGAIHLVAKASAARGESVASAPGPRPGPDERVAADGGVTAGAPVTPWAQCLTGKDGQAPSIAAITYLDQGKDAAVTLGEVRGWFGELAPASVQVWLLESKDARVGRRISFEVPAERWPAWLVVDPSLTREARCDALHRALRAHGVGRPRPASEADAMDGKTRSRHDLELLFPRRAEHYTAMTRLGTVADLTEERFRALLDWLDAPRATEDAVPVEGGVPASPPGGPF